MDCYGIINANQPPLSKQFFCYHSLIMKIIFNKLVFVLRFNLI